MTRLEENVLALQRNLPNLSKRAMYDISDKDEEFCEIVYPNPQNPSCPLTLSIFEDGVTLSFGCMEYVTGEDRISIEDMVCEIRDIIEDKVMFIFCYDSQEKREDSRLSQSFVFSLEAEAEEYEKFIAKIKTPLNKFTRYFAVLKGVFVATNFSGSVNFEIER